MNIVIVGTGNTATVLGRKLTKAGHRILQVLGRDGMAARHLADSLGASASFDWSEINTAAELYLLAVSDTAIATVFNQLRFPSTAIVAHTAASVPLAVLKGKTEKYGVFYPLQSLAKDVDHLPDIPLIVDGNSKATLQQLEELAHSISHTVSIGNDALRTRLHLAAVLVNNFTNHLYALVETFCEQEGLDFTLLQPLILETASRLKAHSPSQTQTGPAVRNDTTTIEKHLRLLEEHPRLKNLYRLFTDSIRQRHEG